MGQVHVTRHAAERWRERAAYAGHTLSRRQAVHQVRLAYAGGVKVPVRHAVRCWLRRPGRMGRRGLRLYRKRHHYRVTAAGVLLCGRHTVITVLYLSVDHLAELLVWLIVGVWP